MKLRIKDAQPKEEVVEFSLVECEGRIDVVAHTPSGDYSILRLWAVGAKIRVQGLRNSMDTHFFRNHVGGLEIS